MVLTLISATTFALSSMASHMPSNTLALNSLKAHATTEASTPAYDNTDQASDKETVTMNVCPVEKQESFRAGLDKDELAKFKSMPAYSKTVTRTVAGTDINGKAIDMHLPNNVYDVFVKGNQCHLRNHYLSSLHKVTLQNGATALTPTYKDETYDFDCSQNSTAGTASDGVSFKYTQQTRLTTRQCSITLSTPRHDVLSING